MKNNKRVTILASILIALVLILAGYLWYSKANADVSQDNYCRGLTGNAWKNCATNAKALQLYLRDTKVENFAGVLKKLDLVRNLTGVVVDNTKPAQKVTFTANPTTINSGATSTLNWTLENVTSCKTSGGDALTNWAGLKEVAKTGSKVTGALTGSATYSLSCTGTDGITKIYTSTVTVNGSGSTTGPTISGVNTKEYYYDFVNGGLPMYVGYTGLCIGAPITVIGTNFGATQGSSKVYYGKVPQTPSVWTDTTITFNPSNVIGKFKVETTNGSFTTTTDYVSVDCHPSM